MAQRTLTDSGSVHWDESTASKLFARTNLAVGQMFLMNNTVETVLTQNIWTKVAGETGVNGVIQRFSSAGGRLIFEPGEDWPEPIVMRVAVSFALIASAGGHTYEFAIYQGNTAAPEEAIIRPESIIPVVLEGPTKTDRIAINLLALFAPNDFVELWVRNISNNSTAIISSMQLTVG